MAFLNCCPVCGSERISLRYSGKPVRPEWRDGKVFDVFGCENCTHGFLNPVLDESNSASSDLMAWLGFGVSPSGVSQESVSRVRWDLAARS